MRRIILVSLCVSAVLLCAAEDYFGWYRVMTDSATPETFWTMCSYSGKPISKKLDLMVKASELKAAALEYVISVNPFDTKRNVHVSDTKYAWGDLLVKVNGQVAFRGPAAPHIVIGTHVIPFPVELLKDGVNLVELSWAPEKPEDKGKFRHGYIYVACDLTDEIRSLKGREARLAKAPYVVRMRLLVK